MRFLRQKVDKYTNILVSLSHFGWHLVTFFPIKSGKAFIREGAFIIINMVVEINYWGDMLLDVETDTDVMVKIA